MNTTTCIYLGRTIRSSVSPCGIHHVSVSHKGREEKLELKPLNSGTLDSIQFAADLIQMGIIGG